MQYSTVVAKCMPKKNVRRVRVSHVRSWTPPIWRSRLPKEIGPAARLTPPSARKPRLLLCLNALRYCTTAEGVHVPRVQFSVAALPTVHPPLPAQYCSSAPSSASGKEAEKAGRKRRHVRKLCFKALCRVFVHVYSDVGEVKSSAQCSSPLGYCWMNTQRRKIEV